LSAGAAAIFLVEQMEGSQAHIGDFFFNERNRLIWYKAQFLWRIRGRHGRRGSASR
jgi:hypothetical protein